MSLGCGRLLFSNVAAAPRLPLCLLCRQQQHLGPAPTAYMPQPLPYPPHNSSLDSAEYSTSPGPPPHGAQTKRWQEDKDALNSKYCIFNVFESQHVFKVSTSLIPNMIILTCIFDSTLASFHVWTLPWTTVRTFVGPNKRTMVPPQKVRTLFGLKWTMVRFTSSENATGKQRYSSPTERWETGRGWRVIIFHTETLQMRKRVNTTHPIPMPTINEMLIIFQVACNLRITRAHRLER